MSTFATPTLSVAVQVIVCGEPMNHVSPPFGLETVTVGAWLSTGTVPGGPATAGRSAFAQSRSLIAVTVIEPGPVGTLLPTATLNSVPLPVGPQVNTAP